MESRWPLEAVFNSQNVESADRSYLYALIPGDGFIKNFAWMDVVRGIVFFHSLFLFVAASMMAWSFDFINSLELTSHL